MKMYEDEFFSRCYELGKSYWPFLLISILAHFLIFSLI